MQASVGSAEVDVLRKHMSSARRGADEEKRVGPLERTACASLSLA